MANANAAPTRSKAWSVEWKLFAIVTVGSLVGMGWNLRSPNAQQPVLAVEPRELDFGEAWMQSSLPWTITLRNVTNRDIVVEKIDSICSCASNDAHDLLIPPGESRDVSFKLDLTKNSHWQPDKRLLPYSVRVIPAIRGLTSSRLSWVIHGTVRSAFGNLPTALQWLDDDDHGQPFTQREITVRTLDDVTAIKVDIPNMQVSPISHVTGGFRFHTTPASSLPHGPYDFHGTVIGTLRDGTTLPSVPIEVSGNIRPAYAAEPESYLFGVARVGDLVSKTIHWTTKSTAQFQVLSMQTSSDDIAVETIDRQRTRIRILTDKPWVCNGNVTCNIRREGNETPFVVHIPVRGSVIQSGSARKVITQGKGATSVQEKDIP